MNGKVEGRIRINHEIRVPRVRLIGPDGQQIGVVDTREALRIARDEWGLDLVEISPSAVPPVCKIIDSGKFKYQQKKKAQEAKKNQSVIQIKEIKFRPQTDKHDIDFKVKHIQRFLSEGNKTKLTIFFRGREMAYKSHGEELLRKIVQQLTEMAVVEQEPREEGRYLSMIIGPRREWLDMKRKQDEQIKNQQPSTEKSDA